MSIRVVSHGLAALASALLIVACAAPPADETDDTANAVSQSPLSYVGEAVTSALDAKYPNEKGSTWNLSRDGKLSGDFVKQFPPRSTWGQTELSIAKRCEATDQFCDKDFLLFVCETDADCRGNGRCEGLKATIAHHGAAPKKLCVSHSDERLDDVWSAISAAKTTLDLSSLSPPDGRFEATIRNAITFASENPSPPRMRIVVGDYWSSGLQKQSAVDGVLASLTRDVAKSSSIDVTVAAYAYGQASWDHAKIIARDGEYALVGGANMWDVHYLGLNPVHDLWIAIEGGPAADAQRFVDRIFQFVCTDNHPVLHLDVVRQSRRGGKGCPVTFQKAQPQGGADQGGGSAVIAVGRTGFAQNPSDDAFLAMINAAKTKIHLSQQDIGPIHRAGIAFGSWPDELLKALIAAMGRGVDVDFVLSNTGAVPGNMSKIEALYNSYDNGWVPAAVAKKFVEVARKNPDLFPAGTDPHALVCEKLQLMRIRSSSADTWPGGGTLANHVKAIMVDDKAFYVGSQNAYAANLTEFGYIVDDEDATKTFIDSYLGNLEKFSRRTAISGPGVACGF
jgi:PLD-like domain